LLIPPEAPSGTSFDHTHTEKKKKAASLRTFVASLSFIETFALVLFFVVSSFFLFLGVMCVLVRTWEKKGLRQR
jgi:hypothetical protein